MLEYSLKLIVITPCLFLQEGPASQPQSTLSRCKTFPLFPGDESLTTENTLIWILSSKTLHVFLCVVPGDEFLTLKAQ